MDIVITPQQEGCPVTVTCPRCGLDYNLDALVQGRDNRLSTVRCSCGEHFLAVADARRHERRNLTIRGMYTVMNDQGLGGLVTLKDISEGGVGFTLAAPRELKPGWLITVVFELAGRQKRVIVAKSTIRSVHGAEVGCSFVNPDQVRQDILAFFDSQAGGD